MINFLKNLFTKYSLGAELNPPDLRDIRLASFQPMVSIPSKHITDIAVLPVWNQGGWGSCVGHAEGKFKQYLDYKDTQRVIPLSARFLYGRSKEIDGLPPNTQGTWPRITAKVLFDQGCATEKTIPNTVSLPYEEYITILKSDEISNDAKPYKIKGYAAVAGTQIAIKQAIYQNGVVSVTVPVGNWSSLPVKPGPTRGYHRILLYAYDEDKIYFRNSWGNWGEGGNGYFLWSNYEGKVFDALVYTDIPNNLLEEAHNTVYKYKYFQPHEIVGLKHELVIKLDQAREKAGVPFIITSGFRTDDRNEMIGGIADSSHLKGLGCDLKATDSQKRYKILVGLLEAEFTRIGIYKTHLHCDIDKSKPQEVVWYA